MLLNFEKDKKEEYSVPMNEGMRRIPAYSILNLLNKIFVRLQRWMQGIPSGPAYLYNCIATKYLEPSYNHVVKEIEERFSENVAIIEVGCGTGRLLSEIISRTKPKDVVGLDISRAIVRISRRNLIKDRRYSSVNLIVAEAHKMPIREECFDLIVNTGTLHHVRKPEEFFKEYSRAKKTGETWIYEFSYGADCETSSKRLNRPCFFLKALARDINDV